MRDYVASLVVVALIGLTILYFYKPDLLESWMNWLLFTR